MWCEIIDGQLPYFYEGILTEEGYLNFLRNELEKYLQTAENKDISYQQHGAPPYNYRAVENYLLKRFNNDNIIGYHLFNDCKNRPTRSPDLNPLDFFMKLS